MTIEPEEETNLDLDTELFPIGEVCSDWDSDIAEQALASAIRSNSQNEEFLSQETKVKNAQIAQQQELSSLDAEAAEESFLSSNLDDELCPLGEVCRDWTG
jgi:hypothetical protein